MFLIIHLLVTAQKPSPLGLGGSAAPLLKVDNKISSKDNSSL